MDVNGKSAMGGIHMLHQQDFLTGYREISRNTGSFSKTGNLERKSLFFSLKRIVKDYKKLFHQLKLFDCGTIGGFKYVQAHYLRCDHGE